MFDISIIVATYNSSTRSIIRTLQSCLSQKNITAQLIVADDGSKQNNFDIIQRFFRHRNFTEYMLLDSETNRGTVENIRNAMQFVKADFVKTIAPGDFFYSVNTLGKMLERIREDNTSFCFGRIVCYDPQDFHKILNMRMPKDMAPYANKSGKIDKSLAKRNLIRYRDGIFGVSLMYRVSDFVVALDALSGKVRLCEDYSVRFLIAGGCDFSFVDEYVVWYEYGTGVSTKKINSKKDPIFSDWCALSDILSERYPNDPDVKALEENLRLKNASLFPPLKKVLCSIKDPGRVLFFVKNRCNAAFHTTEGYNLSSLFQQIDDDEIEALLLDCHIKA